MSQQKYIPRAIAQDVGVELGEDVRNALNDLDVSQRNIFVASEYFHRYRFARFLGSSVSDPDLFHIKRCIDAGLIFKTMQDRDVVLQFDQRQEMIEWGSLPYLDVPRNIRERIWNKRVVDVAGFARIRRPFFLEEDITSFFVEFPERWEATHIRDLSLNFFDTSSLHWIASIGQHKNQPQTILASFDLYFVDHDDFALLYVDMEYML